MCVPVDIPKEVKGTYIFNYQEITRKSGRLMLFAGDQKIEHLNDDFYGEGIAPEDSDPDGLRLSRPECCIFNPARVVVASPRLFFTLSIPRVTGPRFEQ